MRTHIFLIKFIVLILLLLMPLFLLYILIANSDCTLRNFRKETFNGKVVAKYIDTKSSSLSKIKIKGQEYPFIILTRGVNEKKVWDAINLGDSLYKKEDEVLLFIQKKQELNVINFDTIYSPCKEISFKELWYSIW